MPVTVGGAATAKLAPAPAPAACELTVVVPTFNERDNVAPLLAQLSEALIGIAWQVVFVDDSSPDGTGAETMRLAAADPRVLSVRRVGRRGLAGAVLEGVLSTIAPVIAVIDADLQHDAALLPRMFEAMGKADVDLVVGSRFVQAGDLDQGLSPVRRIGSRLATWLARRALKADVSDPVSGFFMLRREVVERVAPSLSTKGFKILFDIIASQPEPLRIVELPYAFGARQAGESKMDGRVALEYLELVVAKLTGGLIPPRALMFFMVGASGVAVQLGVLRAMLGLGLAFAAAQAIGALTAMTSNYLINNVFTYRDRRLRGASLLVGYLKFCLLCSVGLVANVAVADLIHRQVAIWWLAGAGGAVFGALWNYATTAMAVW
ncbi:MAG TPA: glycosyltransferase family 2 protein [Caulobacteraceae bacterium]|nr:glycosyltransferase family 2 protein [Caulobacteraceae bacterium]